MTLSSIQANKPKTEPATEIIADISVNKPGSVLAPVTAETVPGPPLHDQRLWSVVSPFGKMQYPKAIGSQTDSKTKSETNSRTMSPTVSPKNSNKTGESNMARPGESELHTISVLVEDKAGVLARVADLFARRGYNIVSLAVAPTNDARFSRITIVVDVESSPLDQIVKQLNKLINVVEIALLAPQDSVEREIMMATVNVPANKRSEVVEIVDIFEGKILAVASEYLTVSLDGSPRKLDDFEALLVEYSIVDLQRSGRIALPKVSHEAPRLAAVK